MSTENNEMEVSELVDWHYFAHRNLLSTWSSVSVVVLLSHLLRPLPPSSTARRWSAESATYVFRLFPSSYDILMNKFRPVSLPVLPTAERRSADTPTNSAQRRSSSKCFAPMAFGFTGRLWKGGLVRGYINGFFAWPALYLRSIAWGKWSNETIIQHTNYKYLQEHSFVCSWNWSRYVPVCLN